jgi:hypothetical protein
MKKFSSELANMNLLCNICMDMCMCDRLAFQKMCKI